MLRSSWSSAAARNAASWARTRQCLLVVMSVAALVYWATQEGLARKVENKLATPKGQTAAGASVQAVAAHALPGPVMEMRDAILAAVRTGNIEDLKPALQWNELPPVIATGKVDDPIAYWKSISGDGQGREILAVIDNLLAAGHSVLPVGRDVENSKLFVWPRFAEMDLSKLKPEDEVQLYRLATPTEVKAMIAQKKWLGYRLSIGAEGTWHSFQKGE
jgi:hypothetical protein